MKAGKSLFSDESCVISREKSLRTRRKRQFWRSISLQEYVSDEADQTTPNEADEQEVAQDG